MADTTFVDGETLIEASWLNDVNAAVYTPATQTAANIANVPAGSITATDVQAALNELDTEKQPIDALLTSLAGQTTAANKVQAYSGVDTATLLTTGTASGNIPLVGVSSATDALAGLVELATSAEAITGTDTARAVTPAGVVACRDSIPTVKAWINFDGTSASIGTGSASYNVSSVTDNGTGDYTINFTTPMPDANYAISGMTQIDTTGNPQCGEIGIYRGVGALKTTSARIRTNNGAQTAIDAKIICVQFVR